MKTIRILLLLVNILCAQSLYFPPTDNDAWETTSPSDLGWSQSAIDSLLDDLEAMDSHAFLVLKDGKIVIEHYFGDFHADSNWIWYSAGKSLCSVLVGIAQQEGHLSIDDKTSDYLGEGWTSLPQDKEDQITIRNQLTMTTGLDASEFTCTDPACLTWVADAGTRWMYHNSPYSLLRDVIESATGINYNVFTYNRVLIKTGMNGIWLAVGDNNFFFSTARSMARFGLLALNRGMWNDTPVLNDPDYFTAMVNTSQELNPAYGYLWWLNGKSSYIPPGTANSYDGPISPSAPPDMYCAAGAQGQFICVVPSQNLVLVRTGVGNNNLVPLEKLDRIWQGMNNIMHPETGIESNHTVLPDMNSLHQNYPNPFNPATVIPFRLAQNTDISLYITDVTGRRVRTLIRSTLPAGEHSITWNGRDKNGQLVAAGFYFLVLQTPTERLVRKALLLN